MTPGTAFKVKTENWEKFGPYNNKYHTSSHRGVGEPTSPRDENCGPPRQKLVPRGENHQPRVENRRVYLMLNIPYGEN